MQPKIDDTSFGSITIAHEEYDHDVIIWLSGEVKKRKKKLSKALYGTSHMVSLAEAQHVYETGAQRLIIGSGQGGNVTLSDEAKDFFQQMQCEVQLLPTPKAIRVWNEAQGAVIGLFHVTC
ncbi:MAG: hypothetical protein HGB05_02120 [Chloroflexi bacterium]|nr:hypothetical protein [Chloroflexota bacterium]